MHAPLSVCSMYIHSSLIWPLISTVTEHFLLAIHISFHAKLNTVWILWTTPLIAVSSGLFSPEFNLQHIKEVWKHGKAGWSRGCILISSELENTLHGLHCIMLHWGVSLHKQMCAVTMLQEGQRMMHTPMNSTRSSDYNFIGSAEVQSVKLCNTKIQLVTISSQHCSVFQKIPHADLKILKTKVMSQWS